MLKFLAVFSVFILLTTGVVYFVFRSSFFQAAGIEAVGSQRTEEIKRELIGVLSKTSKFRSWLGPENLLFWSSKAVEKIPPSLYWLSDLTLKRNWRLKKIFIEVKERQPWLIWCLQTQTNTDYTQTNADGSQYKSASSQRESAINRCYWLDDSGVVFAFAPEAEGYIIPKVFAEDDRQLLFGQPFLDNPALVKNALEIIKQLKNSSLTISRFLVKNINLQEIEAETDGPKLYLNFRFPLQNLNGLLANLARRLDLQKLEYIDFRVENRIYYK